MNKDVIYIDVEDDITAIIGKIKASKEKIVALVPPRHSTVLQSAVNLRLLERMARGASKQLVVVTNNQALVSLASAAKIPVAKNLQSKPEIADVPALAVDDGDDIIDGSQLPVGEHAAMAKTHEPFIKPKTNVVPVVDSNELENIDIDGEPVKAAGASAVATKAAPASSKKPKSKIPNFNSFRKKLFLGIGGAVVLVALLIWMYVFAPAATIIVTAKAAPNNISGTVTLGGTQATDFSKGVVSSVTQTIKNDNKVTFDATGSKQIGNKATGNVKFTNKTTNDVTIAAGTTITSSEGNNYVTGSAATVPSASLGNCGGIACVVPGQSAAVGITAADVGSGYNTTSGDSFSVYGQPGTVTATATTDITGGTSQTVKAVSQSDVDQAKAKLQGTSQDAIKKQLQAKFTSDQMVISDSFTAVAGDAVSSPAVGEALPDGTTQATLTVSTTYTMTAVPKSAAQAYITAALQAQITNKNSQRIYEGNEKIAFSNYAAPSDTVAASASINAVGYIGPNLQAADIKKQVAGQKTGQVQATMGTIEGVSDVKVNYSYFWVNKVPNDTKKITVEFKISA